MKNVHLIPTEKLVKSKNDLVKDKYGDIHIFTKNDGKEYGKTTTKLNIYITSEEAIKMDDWYLDDTNSVRQAITECESYWTHRKKYQKIILTTDPQLIADGIQPIDNEFLEWFVKNPSCERVEVELFPKFSNNLYGIIIPKEEPKQETLELPKEIDFANEIEQISEYDKGRWYGRIEGAKWQQEQDRWKTVCEETPPIHVELLVKSPEGIVHLSSWRESYNIFSCQAKSESSLNWKWKTI